MKYFYITTICFLLLLNFKSQAQQEFHTYKEASALDIQRPPANDRIFYDTLMPSSQDSIGFGLCSDSLKIYQLNNPATGYIGGNNSHGDKEIMQKFGVTVGGGVYTILGMFGHKTITTGSSMVAKLYSVDPVTHGPDSLIYFTDPVNLSDVNTTNPFFFTTFPFPGVIQQTDSFFASIELPTGTGDTMAVYMTPQNCYSGYQQAYIMKQNGSFQALNGGAGSYGLNADFWIWAVFIPDSSVGNSNSAISFHDLSLFRAFPNPATNNLSVNFSMKNPTPVWVDFVNELGEIVATKNLGFLLTGIHSINLDVSDLPPANYYYAIATPQERLFSKVCIVHQ
ncbi:MAG: hypothetical protein WCI97_00280 [Bacteroidota bacterium]